MLGCCVEAIVGGWDARSHIDREPKLVKVTIPGIPFHVYYRSLDFIHNPESKEIPPYVGHPSNAPLEYYGPGTFEVDDELMEDARPSI